MVKNEGNSGNARQRPGIVVVVSHHRGRGCGFGHIIIIIKSIFMIFWLIAQPAHVHIFIYF